jgi:CHASE2 domain-containing sensor protein
MLRRVLPRPLRGAGPVAGPSRLQGLQAWLRRPQAAVPLGAFLVAVAVGATPLGARMHRSLDDMLLAWIAPPLSTESVMVVDVDEESIRRLAPTFGPWPFRRDVHALVIDELRRVGARAIVFGIVFADEREGDEALRRSLQAPGAPVVLAAAAWCRGRLSPGAAGRGRAARGGARGG